MDHPLINQISSALDGLIPREAVELRGEWSTHVRRTDHSEAQLGTGSDPFVDVVDLCWRGELTASSTLGGIAFLATQSGLHWAKAATLSAALPVTFSLTAYARHAQDGATFTASMGGVYLPGVPVAVDTDLAAACAIAPGSVTTGRVTCLAHATSASFLVLLIQRDLLRVGRARLWRVREHLASSLPPPVRDLLTRRRTGEVPRETASS